MRIIIFLSALIYLTACGKAQDSSATFRKPTTLECERAVIGGSYLVRWKNGYTSVEHALNDQEFIEEFISANESLIEFAEPNYKIQVDASSVRAAAYADNWGPQKIKADSMWQQNVRGQNVIVAVIDTGVDVSHPQLSGRIAVNRGEAGVLSQNGIDDDGDGYIDNYYGYDFAYDRPLIRDNQFHGTHVAGIIAAAHNDVIAQGGSQAEGIAPEAKILPLAFLDSEGSGEIADVLPAFDYAVAHGAKVINASWGGRDCSVALQAKIESLEEQGVIFVSAAGNEHLNIDSVPRFPAALNLFAQITVGSSTASDFMAEHSNYGRTRVHIFAPGESIVSTMPGNQLGELTGTSMATPFVSGAVALLLSAEPTANIEQIREALYQAAFHPRARYLNASNGRLDLADALSALRSLMNP